ncbi:hypothetical protein KFL_002880070 [Klebsormidium nitens]|uniref:Uncharacterized protein n=1 Tax=Klebsormidium nitens TaxID=105231 RepID=A0A0U9HM35_KLENI|nr:hypothetical protein KFL_002880070 [Klebsormidium nitens]|eukprot:GAQ86423.1 hypothetical protein KFL_002880070 [Klebsormidium nitens]
MEREEFQEALKKFPRVRDKDYKAPDTMLAATTEAPSSCVSGKVQHQLLEDSERHSERKALSAAAGELAEKVTGSAQTRARVAPVGTASRPQARSFWERLEEVVAQQLPKEDANKFCSRFRSAHKELVEHRLSLDAIERIVVRWGEVGPTFR